MERVVSFSFIIVGGVPCFFSNYCLWNALFFLLKLLLVECVVFSLIIFVECVVSSSLIIVGGVRCFFFNYC